MAGRSSSDSSSTPRYSMPASRRAFRIGGNEGRPRTRIAIEGFPSVAIASWATIATFAAMARASASRSGCTRTPSPASPDLRGRGGRIPDGTALEIVCRRQERREGLVDPVDDRAARSEIAPESLGVERDATDALALCLQEERNVRLAECVDGLHRIAHAEQASAIRGLPAGHEQLEQSRLRRRRVLVFVDQQVTDPVVERERELRWCRIKAERVARGRGDCRDDRGCHVRRIVPVIPQPRAAERTKVHRCAPTGSR